MLIGEHKLKKILDRVMHQARAVIDYKENGMGDAVLLCHRSIIISGTGTSGKGYGAWAKIHLEGVGTVGVMSIHAPTKRRLRRDAWRWVREVTETGKWIICGDFNMVEYPEDTIGPSPLMEEHKRRCWDLVVGSGDLVDARLCASEAKGPHFTRQAWYGERFDQSRLDRFYITERGEWIHHIKKVEHQGARTLSDHIPIKLEVVFRADRSTRRRKRSYFKMDERLLRREGVMEKIKKAWESHPYWARDRRKRWGLALGRLRDILMEEKAELTPGPAPEWLSDTGCEIAAPGRPFIYLGVQTSSPIDERAITESIVQKMMKKLNHWSNKLLSWPARTILLKHVLAATPLYQLMSVGLCRDGIEDLERLCRTFLWGWNEDGGAKTSLVA
ncbi:hypothetical protein R1sor_027388 [Riccia sorocarpa]|uniref:Endonuclease/exonuclease/phosphatase domain-containing protein n=1 Tax=Riccia sorocarpa TaxID=122646 RepID=A0ABD3GHC5_9MARC